MITFPADRPPSPPTGVHVERISRSSAVGDGDPFRSSVVRERDDLHIAVEPVWMRQLFQMCLGLLFLATGPLFLHWAATEPGATRPENIALAVMMCVACMGMGYALLAVSAYTIRLQLHGDDLQIQRRGLPWKGRHRRMSNLRSLRYERVAMDVNQRKNQPPWVYELRGTDARGEDRALAQLTEEEQARYVVDAINELLTSDAPAKA
jgi:hypothetical protein